MTEKFLITGLPRSKTAWFSVLATFGQSVCYHEPTANLSCFEDLEALWGDDRYAYVGVSDSSLVMQLGRILSEIKPRVLIIERDPSDAARACEIYMAGCGYPLDATGLCNQFYMELERFRGHPLVRWLDYDATDEAHEIVGALNYLAPGMAFPKVSELMHMNVQVERNWVLQKAKEPHTNWHMDTSWSHL